MSHQQQDVVFVAPGGLPGKEASDILVNVTGGSDNPQKLGDALQGGGNSGGLSDYFANDHNTTSGLTYGYKAGVVGVVSAGQGSLGSLISAGTVALTDNTDNLVYFDPIQSTVIALDLDANQLGVVGSVPIAIVTTSSGQITNITDARAFLSPVGGIFMAMVSDLSPRAFAPPPIPGLNFSINGSGNYASPVGVGGLNGNVDLADNSTNYVELAYDPDGSILLANTIGFSPYNISVAIVTTSGGNITNVQDQRPTYFIPSGYEAASPQSGEIAVNADRDGRKLFISTTDATYALPSNDDVPVAHDGLEYKFLVESGTTVVQANTGQTIRIAESSSSSGGTALAEAQGSALTLVLRGTTWYSMGHEGTWTLE